MSQFLSAKFSQLGSGLIGSNSLYDPRGYRALTPVHKDPTVYITPLDGNTTPAFGSTVRFALPKSSTLIGKPTLQLDISAAVMNGAVSGSAAYVKNAGDLICKEVKVRSGTNELQRYPGVFQAIWRRLCKHDINIEAVNAEVLSGTNPGATGNEGARLVPTVAHSIFVPLEEIYWHHNKDEFWFPESLALEGVIEIELEQLARLVYTNNGLSTAFTTRPAITAAYLRYEEVTLTAAEKENRLKLFSTKDGHVIHMLDLERQENFTFTATGALQTVRVPLDNVRMDMAEIMFVIRRSTGAAAATTAAVDKDWAGSKIESNGQPSIVTGLPVNCVVAPLSFKLQANGKDVFGEQPEFYNRTEVRKSAHPESQIADGFYIFPIAEYVEDRKNACGHLSATVLGKLEIVINFPAYVAPVVGPPYVPEVGLVASDVYRVDVYVHSHNFIQSRGGGIAKAAH